MDRGLKIKKLKEKIDVHIKNGGSIYDSKKDIPYYSYLVDFIRKDKEKGITSSVESLYRECGIEYTSKKKEVTLERIKKEIDEFVENGGDIYDKKENLPYYDLISAYIRKYPDEELNYKKIYELSGYEYTEKNEAVTIERLKRVIDEYVSSGGDIYEDRDNKPYYSLLGRLVAKYKKEGINYTYEDIMGFCGYEYLNHKRNNVRLLKLFESIKDDNGYIDALKKSKEGKKVLYSIQDRAKNKELSVNEYLMITFGVRFSSTYSDVDYVSLVESDLKEYENKYGYKMVNHKDIREKDPRLIYRIHHLSRYFPCGSVTPSEVLNFFGYESEAKEKKMADEELLISKLNMLFPDKRVYGLTSIRSVYDEVVKFSAYYDQTIDQYLNGKGFEIKASKPVYRLSKAKQDNDDELFKYICFLRKELMSKSNVLNNPNSTQSDINKELELIADKVANNVKNLKKGCKR